MDGELYLILHKVRGEPAFDVAQRLCSGNGKACQPNCGHWNGQSCNVKDEWIIPTSGHTAYPSFSWKLNSVCDGNGEPLVPFMLEGGTPTADWPDHYDSKTDNTKYVEQARAILLRKGLIKLKDTSPTQLFRRA